MEPIIAIESTQRGLDDFETQQGRLLKFKRSDNCTCYTVRAIAEAMGADSSKVFAWGCPNCDPSAKRP